MTHYWTIVVARPTNRLPLEIALRLRLACSGISGCAQPRASTFGGVSSFDIDVPDQQRKTLFAELDNLSREGFQFEILNETSRGWL